MPLTRRVWLASTAAFALPSAFAQSAPLTVWIEPATAFGLDVQAVFTEAAARAPTPSHELEPLSPGSASNARVRMSPRLQRFPATWEGGRLALSTRVEIDSPASGRLNLECATESAVILPYQGEGGWDEEGRHALRSAVRRCARDVMVLVQTELSMRRRGYWPVQVPRDRRLSIQLEVEVGHPVRDCLVIRENGATLFLAETDDRGRLSDNRLIVDKPLLLDRAA